LVLIACLLAVSPASAVAPNDLDADFGVGGESPLRPTISSVGDVPSAIQPDGKILVGYLLKDQQVPTVTRLNADGSVDTSFGTAGSITVPLPGGSDIYLSEIVVGADGTIFLGASYFRDDPVEGFVWSPVFWARTPSGAPKSDFGTGGQKIVVPDANEPNYLRGMSLAPDGKLVYTYTTRVGAQDAIGLTVMHPNGTVANAGITGEVGVDIEPAALTVTANGRILIGAYYGPNGNGTIKLRAFTSTTAPDSSWGTSGSQSFGFTGVYSSLYGLVSLGNRAAAYGQTAEGVAATFYEADGKLATTAGSQGTNRFSPFNGSFSSAYTGAATGSGKLLLAGLSSTGPAGQGFIARLSADGALDASFLGGVVSAPNVTSTTFGVHALSDGKYLAIAFQGNTYEIRIRRYWGEAQPQAASAGFASSLKSKMKAKKLKTIKGTASGTQLTKVELALQKVDTKLLKKKKRCTYIKSTKNTIKKIKAVKKKCVPSVWIAATGTTNWSVKLKKVLKPGKYVISVRATGLAGIGAVKSKKVTLTK
jgi:uncharacterized delta-60 repeat protein